MARGSERIKAPQAFLRYPLALSGVLKALRLQGRRRRVAPGLPSTARPLRAFNVLEGCRSTLYPPFLDIYIPHAKAVGTALCGREPRATHSDG